jgi:peptidoglycan/LPS O-acetylase OafA/YrhL
VGTVRFLLALSVVVSHSPSNALAGVPFLPANTAVQAFYIVSGFLITMILNERAEYCSTRNFYLARYLRLWPTYVVVAALSLVFLRWHALSELSDFNFTTVAFVAFANLTLFFQDWFLFLQIDQGALAPTADFHAGTVPQLNTFLLVPQAWTLGVELSFYLIAPWLCRRQAGVAALFSFGLAVRLVVGAWQPSYDPWDYRFAPAEMMLFGAGGLSYFWAQRWRVRLPDAAVRFGPALCLAMIGLAIVIVPPVGMFVRNALGQSFMPALWLPMPGFLLTVALACPVLFYGWRKTTWDIALGELSYPIYISHVSVFEVLRRSVPDALLAGNLLYVATTIAFSAALLILVGLPVDRIRARFGARFPLFKMHSPPPDNATESTNGPAPTRPR